MVGMVGEQLELAGFPAPAPDSGRDHKGRFRRIGEAPPASAEVATVQKGEFLFPITIWEFPNISKIIRYRSEGQGIRFYDTMLGTDSDLAGFFQDMYDDVLHYPWVVRPASEKPDHQLQAEFVRFAIKHIPH